jgi:hypothetical protein
MSLHQKLEIKCPQCGNEQDVSIWQSINATVDPEARQELLDGRVNLFHCSKCAYEAAIVTDLLYHDMKRQFWVRYHPFESLNKDGFFDYFTSQGEPKPDNDVEANAYIFQRPHIVFDMGELVRYIIFRERLFEHNNQWC